MVGWVEDAWDCHVRNGGIYKSKEDEETHMKIRASDWDGLIHSVGG